VARTLNSITIVTPTSDPNIAVGGNFTFEVSLGYSGGGGWNTYDIKFEVNDGGGWVTITAATGLSIDTGTYTNPLLNQSDGANVSMVIDGDVADVYDIRAVGDPNAGNDSYTVVSGTQQVTVTGPPEASGSVTLGSATATGATAQTLKPSGSVTLGNATASGTALVPRVWSVNQNISPTTLPGIYGTFTKAAGNKEASGSVTLGSATASGSAAQILKPSGSVTLGSPTATGTAAPQPQASGSVTLGSATATGSVEQTLKPSGSVTLEQATASGTAGRVLSATGSPTLESATATGTATAASTLTASGAVTLGEATATGTTAQTLKPSGSVTLESPTASGATAQTLSISGSVTLESATSSAQAAQILKPSGAVTLLEATATGSAAIEGAKEASGSVTLGSPTATGSVGQTLSLSGSVELLGPTSTGLTAQTLAVSGSLTLQGPTASGAAEIAGQKAATGSVTLSTATATGVVTNIVGITAQRNMGPHGLLARYPDVLRHYGVTVEISGRGISAEAGNTDVDLPVSAIQLGPHGLVTYDRQFSVKGIGPATANITGAQIDLEFAVPDSADATIYPDGEDADADAGSVSEAEAQVSGAEIQALAGTSVSAVNISPTITGVQIQGLAGESKGIPGVGVTPDGASIVAQAGTTDQHYDYAVFGMSGAEIVCYHAEVGWDTNFDVGALVYGEEIVSGFGTVTQETRPSVPQQGSWMGGGGGKRKKKRKKFKKRKFHMPLAGVKLRDRPFENPVIEEEIEQIVDEVIEAAEELEAKGYAEAISADIIAEMARLKAATDEALIRGIRNTEAVSRRLAEAKLGARINELVRRRRAYIRVEHERILRDQRERARQQELERKRQREYEIRKARAEWRAELLLNQPIEKYYDGKKISLRPKTW
jgi:hypothetical protein